MFLKVEEDGLSKYYYYDCDIFHWVCQRCL